MNGWKEEQTGVVSSSLRYLPARPLHQGLCYGVEVGFAAKKAVKEHQGSALSLPIEDVIGEVDRAAGGKKAFDSSQIM